MQGILALWLIKKKKEDDLQDQRFIQCSLSYSISTAFLMSTSPECLFVGADITDYFNYGFTEDTWKQYCEKQRRMRMELQMPKKIFVSLSIAKFCKA